LLREAPVNTQGNLNIDRIGSMAIALAPADEQQLVVARIEELSASLDVAIAADRREIGLLNEFRTRIIADVVTGKLDVREVAAVLPDEPPEDDAGPLGDEEAPETDFNAEDDEADLGDPGAITEAAEA
jgi:type I restriction enzyme S subunit